MTIKTAVVGYGYSSKTFHIPFLINSDHFDLVAIKSSKPDEINKDLPAVKAYTDMSELLKNTAVELVIITAPSQYHYELATSCLQAKKHVIIEKPMVSDSAQGHALVALAKQQGVICSVYHNRRWDGDFLTVKKLIKSGKLGAVRYVESHFDRFRPMVRDRWREQAGPGTGIWFDLGSHLLDQALCLFGRPQAITARCIPLRDNSTTTDFFHVLLHYPQLEMVLHGSPYCAAPNIRFQVQGSKGAFIKFGLDPQEEQLKAGIKPIENSGGVIPKWGKDNAEQYGILYTEEQQEVIATEDGCYQNYYLEIAEAILKGHDVPVTAEEGLNVIKLVELAILSSDKGKTLSVDDYWEMGHYE
ncbi:oxidoreductase [Zooshikella harenae]|uniref:Oxidoreductase n=1 Tax=Zooshikella harenae TaxID=2827238 RepID=A0ABS5ZD79_9GAMM|nr:oxidoreductase [Zooshikella harenae]MBU2712014.1 oxidoreductase [Zooshikella harenae]